jgi:hypothetical protein
MHDIQLRSDERRRQPRSRMLGLAKINLLGPYLLMHCVVIDWSRGGARLQFEDTSLCPDSFILIGADDWFEDCRVAWRKDDQIGVQFVKGIDPDVHCSQVRREGEASAKTVNQIPFLLRGFWHVMASASLNAYRELRPTR